MTQDNNALAQEREIVRTALYEGLTWFGTLPEPEGDVPSRYHRWDDLGEFADRILSALRQPAPASGEVGELVDRLREGVTSLGMHDDNSTELFDVTDADEAMFEAADMLERLAGSGEKPKSRGDRIYETADTLARQMGGRFVKDERWPKVFAPPPTQQPGDQVERARQEAITLIDELNERATSRKFYGIDQTLHAKLCTIRATLARAAIAAMPSGEVIPYETASLLKDGKVVVVHFDNTTDAGKFFKELQGRSVAAMPLSTPPAQGEG